MRELQYPGLVEIQKQGCGKPNRIFPKSYEAVSNTDFKKSVMVRRRAENRTPMKYGNRLLEEVRKPDGI